MAALGALLGRLLLFVAGNVIAKLLLGLGVGVIAYTGVSAAVSQLLSYVNTLLGGIDPIYQQAFDAFAFVQAINIITAAYVTRFGLNTAYKVALRRAAS